MNPNDVPQPAVSHVGITPQIGVQQALENFANAAKEITKQHESGLITHQELFSALTHLVVSNWVDSTGAEAIGFDQNTGLSILGPKRKS